MSSLTSTEARRFERVLGLVGMNSGGVLDFSNDRLQEFVKDSTGLDIYDAKYSPYGTSKANRLRGFWNVEPDARVAKLLNDLLDYGVENRIITNDVELVICRASADRPAAFPDASGRRGVTEYSTRVCRKIAHVV
jgi:hypothetical protein